MRRVLCAGHVNWDVTLRVDDLPERDGEARIEQRRGAGGGSAANVACALAGLGVDAALFGSVGDDDPGRLARRELETAGVDCRHLVETDGSTAVKYLVVDGDGEVVVLGSDGANEAFAPDDLAPGAIRRVDHLHLTGQRPETAARLADRAREADATVSFDPGRRLCVRDYSATLERADVVFLNEREADALADALSSDARGWLDATVLVVTQGAGGARVRTAGDRYRHPGYDVTPIDTTGAGDAFAAGFLAACDGGLPEGGRGYERALAAANACGALASTVTGARADLSADDVRTLVAG
ncbi:carbohydrate kinase family protein [Halomarina halobia]|uniref:Carbohydrate kinase family protein n=1 Tax=Halomarina halobia TaxID=3033386 RepID=A0ABD6A560_9EURY|nr:PfkB family carbohydrate kinase [Halomarina sp. PSR21]